MSTKIVRRRVLLSKSRRRRLLLTYLGTRPPAPKPNPVNPDFYALLLRKPASKLIRKKRPHRKRKNIFRLYLASQVRPVAVPNVVLDLVATALTVLEAISLIPAQTFKASLLVPAGRVISQTPLPGRLVPPNTIVNLVVSTGSSEVPNLINETVVVAVEQILSLALIPSIAERPTDSVAPGTVVAQEPIAGTDALVGSTVFITIAVAFPPGAARDELPSLQDLVSVTVTVH